jgi:hypothetical protein
MDPENLGAIQQISYERQVVSAENQVRLIKESLRETN